MAESILGLKKKEIKKDEEIEFPHLFYIENPNLRVFLCKT